MDGWSEGISNLVSASVSYYSVCRVILGVVMYEMGRPRPTHLLVGVGCRLPCLGSVLAGGCFLGSRLTLGGRKAALHLR